MGRPRRLPQIERVILSESPSKKRRTDPFIETLSIVPTFEEAGDHDDGFEVHQHFLGSRDREEYTSPDHTKISVSAAHQYEWLIQIYFS